MTNAALASRIVARAAVAPMGGVAAGHAGEVLDRAHKVDAEHAVVRRPVGRRLLDALGSTHGREATGSLSVPPETVCRMESWTVTLVAVVVAAVLGALVVHARGAARLVQAVTERDLLRARVDDLESALVEDSETASALRPVHESLGRMERQVAALERDRIGAVHDDPFGARAGRGRGVVAGSPDRLPGRLGQRIVGAWGVG